tara:strand:- start:990 stop:1331 length:342 start_codon:yes stop_codon:yes gene_type:complete
MAKGDLTKEIVQDKIEIVNTWTIQIRTATKVMEEQADGSKLELNRSFHRHLIVPFSSSKDSDGKWTHTATDISNEPTWVQGIANAAWTNDVKTKYKAWRELVPEAPYGGKLDE